MHRRFNLTFLRILRLDAENYLFAINWNNLKIELAAQKICRSWGKYKNIALNAIGLLGAFDEQNLILFTVNFTGI